MGRPLKLTGQTFGRLTVLKRLGKNSVGNYKWQCLCSCGNEAVVDGGNLTSGTTRSCGCLLADTNTKHGFSPRSGKRITYQSWDAMIQRTTNPNNQAYSYYGGRGITVCSEWRQDFRRFLADMGERPSPEMTLDRIDPNGNYEPGNVRWADRSTQRLNQRGA